MRQFAAYAKNEILIPKIKRDEKMQVFLVMFETSYSGDEHSHWSVERVFSTMDSASEYVSQKKLSGNDCEYDIQTEEVYA